MSIEYIGEKIFLEEIEASGQVWIARGAHKNIYALDIEKTGFSLPVWSSGERVVEYLKNARPIGRKYEPEAVPLDVFTDSWLSDKSMGISELYINPDGKSTRVLVFTTEEFQESQASK